MTARTFPIIATALAACTGTDVGNGFVDVDVDVHGEIPDDSSTARLLPGGGGSPTVTEAWVSVDRILCLLQCDVFFSTVGNCGQQCEFALGDFHVHWILVPFGINGTVEYLVDHSLSASLGVVLLQAADTDDHVAAVGHGLFDHFSDFSTGIVIVDSDE